MKTLNISILSLFSVIFFWLGNPTLATQDKILDEENTQPNIVIISHNQPPIGEEGGKTYAEKCATNVLWFATLSFDVIGDLYYSKVKGSFAEITKNLYLTKDFLNEQNFLFSTRSLRFGLAVTLLHMLDHSDLKTTLLFYTLVAALSDNYKNLTGYLINENFPKLYISERISCFDSLKWAASGYLTYQFIKKTGGADCVTKGIQGAFSYGKRMTWDRFFRKKRTL